MLKFILYLLRWQLSTPVLWLVVRKLGTSLESTILANLIGASIFFWVDRFIFRSSTIEQWEILRAGRCADCGKAGLVRRLVLAPGGYDRRRDANPQYRCSRCSKVKLQELRLKKKVATA